MKIEVGGVYPMRGGRSARIEWFDERRHVFVGSVDEGQAFWSADGHNINFSIAYDLLGIDAMVQISVSQYELFVLSAALDYLGSSCHNDREFRAVYGPALEPLGIKVEAIMDASITYDGLLEQARKEGRYED